MNTIGILSCANLNSGIGRYSSEIHKEFLKQGVNSHYLSREKSFLDHSSSYFFPFPRNYRFKFAPYFLSNHLKKWVKSSNPSSWLCDWVDSNSALAKSNMKGKVITTIHDVIPLIYPKNNAFDQLYKKRLSDAALNSEYLIVVSQQSKTDVLRLTNIPKEKIKVIYNGINHEMFFPSSKKIPNKKFTIRFHGGIGSEHKNVKSLVEVSRILDVHLKDYIIELAGANPNSTKIPSLIRANRLKNIRCVGFISDSKIQDFLSNADVYVYPSKYEGFGFTPIEAMACGTAVVSSNGGSLAEILGDGAICVEPNAEAIAEQIVKLYHDSQLRNELTLKGINRSKLFQWEKCATTTFALFNE